MHTWQYTLTPRRLVLLIVAMFLLLLAVFVGGLALGVTLWVPGETEIAARKQRKARLLAQAVLPDLSLAGITVQRSPVAAAGLSAVARYVVQAGSFADPENARKLAADLSRMGYHPRVLQAGSWHVVEAGRFPSAREAERAASELAAKGRIAAQVRRGAL